MQWSHEILDRLQVEADPEADAIAAEYRRRHPDLDLRGLIRQVRVDMHGPPAHGADAISLPRPELGPALRDEAKLLRGQQVFQRYGLEMSIALYMASLPISYAIVAGAEVLARVSDLATGSLNRRVAETGQMMIDVMGVTGSQTLTEGTAGYASCQGVRLMHATARALIKAGDEQARADGDDKSDALWDFERHGEPLSQETMLGTIMAFTYVSWIALERFGIDLDREDKEAHAYAWSVVAGLLGVDEDLLPLGVDDMEQLVPLMWERHVGRSTAGIRLAGALLSEMEEMAPLGLRRVPASMIRWLFRDEMQGLDLTDLPDLLDIPPASRAATLIFDGQRRINQLVRPLRGTKTGRWFFRKVARMVLTGYIDRNIEGQPPFQVPAELARGWRIRSDGASARVRRVRAAGRVRTRQAARSAGVIPMAAT